MVFKFIMGAIAVIALSAVVVLRTMGTTSVQTRQVLIPTPIPAPQAFVPLYQPVHSKPFETVNAQGTVHVEPFSVVMDDGKIEPLESQTDFVVLKTPADGTGRPGSYFANEGLTRTYVLSDRLQAQLEDDYRHDCTTFGKCQWIEVTLENGKLTRNIVGQRPELLRTPTPTNR